jgi:hypothetical protein
MFFVKTPDKIVILVSVGRRQFLDETVAGGGVEEPVPSSAEGTPTVLIVPMLLGPFDHRSPLLAMRHGLFLERLWDTAAGFAAVDYAETAKTVVGNTMV